MALIFVSHSKRDAKQLDFINKAFASSNVQAKYEEIEAIESGARTSEQIKNDIQQSVAVFIILGRNVETLKHTRDWVTWESGVGCNANKDIWIIEPVEESVHLSVVIPHVRYVCSFQYTDQWLAQLRTIINSYDDSQFLKAMAVGAGLGAAVGEGAGAVVGGLAGLVLASASQTKARPAGTPVSCPQCKSLYNVFLSVNLLRCPVCNVRMQFQQQLSPAPNQSPDNMLSR